MTSSSLATVSARDGQGPAVAPRRLAELALAFSAGAALEQAADPAALGGRQVAAQLAQVLGPLVRPAAPAPVAGSGTS
jgi:hypothetical protein